MNRDLKRIVIFGAGKIGRSFIGQVFSQSGYEVVFVDIDAQLIGLLNQRKSYTVVFKSNEGDSFIQVSNVRGLHWAEKEKIINELANSKLAALSVGQNGLPSVISLIAESLLKSQHANNGHPLDIIIAENMRNADMYISDALKKMLPQDYPINENLGLVETSIGKMVPIMAQRDIENDPMQVFAEPYNTLIVSKTGFKNPIPEVSFLAPKENIKAWVDRKLFIHNLGHVAAAYLGFQKHPHLQFIYQVLDDPEIFNSVKQTMLESAEILRGLYPGEFTYLELEEHINDLINRFKNKALGDTLFRVGSDLPRKLSPNDRLAAPINAAIGLSKPYGLILKVVEASLSFQAKDENGQRLPQDVLFDEVRGKGLDYVIYNVCGFNINIKKYDR